MISRRSFRTLRALALCCAAAASTLPAPAWSQTTPGLVNPDASSTGGAPVRLRQPSVSRPDSDEGSNPRPGTRETTNLTPPYVPGEFEKFVQTQVGVEGSVRRFGSELVNAARDINGADAGSLPPADYVVGPGDEILVTLWGSVDADLRLTVDSSGRISVPRVGVIQVGGVRYGDLPDVINRRVAQTFRNYQLNVSLGQLRGIRVFVTGFVIRPGAYAVTSLSTVVSALMQAGGPSAAGSFRNIELRRGSQLVVRLDLYDLLLKGDRGTDRILQAGDVVHVGPVGTQVGVVGSVNQQVVLELTPGETVTDALRMAGGFSAVADRTRLALERLQDRNTGRLVQLELPRDQAAPLSDGDVMRAFSAVVATLPTKKQNKRVRVEGEVQRPADYVLPEGSTIRDAVRASGGFTTGAFVFATEFHRVSVQRTQQENYERVLRDLETDLARSVSSQRIVSGEDAAAATARRSTTSQLVDRLRTLKPSGRIVLQLEPGDRDLPDLELEDGDRIYVPPRPTTVGVFGSVFNAATYLYLPERRVSEYVRLAGGPKKGADEDSMFVVRANGSVANSPQRGGWFSRTSSVSDVRAEPGDTIFVPEELDKTTWMQHAKDWTQILSQFGLGAAAIKVLGN